MKFLLLTMLLLGFTQLSYANDLGKQVDIYSDDVGPQFGTMFSYDGDKAWLVTISLWGGDLLPNLSMKTLSWRLLDSKSGKYINQWTVAVNDSSPMIYTGTMAYSWTLERENEILAAIKTLANLQLVLSVDQDLSAPVPTHFVDLGSYCNSNPDNFVNITTGESGCKAD